MLVNMTDGIFPIRSGCLRVCVVWVWVPRNCDPALKICIYLSLTVWIVSEMLELFGVQTLVLQITLLPKLVYTLAPNRSPTRGVFLTGP